ncbi:MAG: hypothetical protein ACJAVK_001315 [Akkermansiaceae bacterium]|jgi:hypothetical protein
MDPEVLDNPAHRDVIIKGLQSLCTLSIVVPNDEFFNNSSGI